MDAKKREMDILTCLSYLFIILAYGIFTEKGNCMWNGSSDLRFFHIPGQSYDGIVTRYLGCLQTSQNLSFRGMDLVEHNSGFRADSNYNSFNLQAQQITVALENEDLYSVALSLLSLMENMGLSATTYSLGKSEEEFSKYLTDGGPSLAIYMQSVVVYSCLLYTSPSPRD